MRILGCIALAFVALSAATQCVAGGTDSFACVDRLLRAQPDTYKWLSTALELPDSVYAEVRFGDQFKHLSGRRMGPYTFSARSRTPGPTVEVQVVICTTVRFLDKAGRQLSDSRIEEAASIDEKLVSIQVQDSRRDQPPPQCPN